MSTCINTTTDDTKSLVSLYVNSFSCNHAHFTDAMALENEVIQHNFTVLCLNWFISIGKVRCFDDRNEDSVNLGKRVAEEFHNETIAYQKSSYEDVPKELSVNYRDSNEVEKAIAIFLCHSEEVFELFIQKFLCEHRTLQQNFSQLCMSWLNAVSNDKGSSKSSYVQMALRISALCTGLRYI